MFFSIQRIRQLVDQEIHSLSGTGSSGWSGWSGKSGTIGTTGISGFSGVAANQPLFYNLASTGVQKGGVISRNLSDARYFRISAGNGFVIDNTTNPNNPTITPVSWSDLNVYDEHLADGPRTYVFIDSTGSVVQQTAIPTQSDMRSKILIGRTVHSNLSSISSVASMAKVLPNSALDACDIMAAIGTINVSGNVTTANGHNLKVNRTAGQTYRYDGNYPASSVNPSIVTNPEANPLSFKYRTKSGSTFVDTASITDIDPTLYYDEDSDSLLPVPDGDWTIQRCILYSSGNSYFIYGKNHYRTLAEAVEGINYEDPIVDEIQTSDANQRVILVVRQDCADLSDQTTCQFIMTDRFGAPIPVSFSQDFVLLYNLASTGLRSGGLITVNADPTKFNIAAGEGYVIDNNTDPRAPLVIRVSWDAKSGIVDLYTSYIRTYVFINSDGTVYQSPNMPELSEFRDRIYLGRVLHSAGVGTSTTCNAAILLDKTNDLLDLALSVGPINYLGNKFTPNGANLRLNRSTGVMYRLHSNYASSRKSPNIITNTAESALYFRYRRRNGSGGFVGDLLTRDIDTTHYDNNGISLSVVPEGRWTIQRIYFANAGNTFIQYGQAYYENLQEAVAGISDEDFVMEPALYETNLRCYLLVKSGATDLSNPSEARFFTTDRFGNTSAGAGGFLESFATGNAFDFVYDETTSGEPPSGHFGFNTLTLASATEFRASYVDAYGADVSDWFSQFVAAGNTSSNGLVKFRLSSDGTSWLLFRVDSVTDQGSYATIQGAAVATSTGVDFDQNDLVSLSFTQTGQSGTSGQSGGPGPQGVSGPQGTQGNQGISGTSGATGSQGTEGESGTSGYSGPQGQTGALVGAVYYPDDDASDIGGGYLKISRTPDIGSESTATANCTREHCRSSSLTAYKNVPRSLIQ